MKKVKKGQQVKTKGFTVKTRLKAGTWDDSSSGGDGGFSNNSDSGDNSGYGGFGG